MWRNILNTMWIQATLMYNEPDAANCLSIVRREFYKIYLGDYQVLLIATAGKIAPEKDIEINEYLLIRFADEHQKTLCMLCWK